MDDNTDGTNCKISGVFDENESHIYPAQRRAGGRLPGDLPTPLFLLGGEWFGVFWTRNWPIAIVFLVTLGCVDLYFLLNWRLFRDLGERRMGGVPVFLEERRFPGEGCFPGGCGCFRIPTWYLQYGGNPRPGGLPWKRKPGLINRFSLSFGIPHLLAKDPKDRGIFPRHARLPAWRTGEWVKWNHAFSLLQMKRARGGQGGARRPCGGGQRGRFCFSWCCTSWTCWPRTIRRWRKSSRPCAMSCAAAIQRRACRRPLRNRAGTCRSSSSHACCRMLSNGRLPPPLRKRRPRPSDGRAAGPSRSAPPPTKKATRLS